MTLCILGSIGLCTVTFLGIRSRFVPPTPKPQVMKGKAVSVYVDDGTGVYRANEDGTFPTDGYVLNTELSGCANGGVLSQNPETKTISLSVSGSDQCHVYFDKENLARKTLQALNLTVRNDEVNFDSPASDSASAGVYELADEGGTSYYFRGPVENNYVRFGKWRADEPDVYVGHNSSGNTAKDFASLSACQANSSYKNNCALLQRAGKDMYWRIVRVNGDGSLRMIYAGTSAYANDSQGDDTFITRGQQFNALYDDAKYVGYMYSPVNVTTGTTTHSTASTLANPNEVSSDIKVALEEWYANNLEANYGQYISKDAIYCYDRSTPGKSATGWTDDTGLGYGTNKVAFGATARTGVFNSATTASAPNFVCTQNNDKFTSKNSTAEIGNKKLEYPVGLISADEILAAGSGKYATASNYYLKRNLLYWSGSPYYYFGSAYVFFVDTSGDLSGIGVGHTAVAAAPVINLTPEYASTLVGDGTASNPYHEATWWDEIPKPDPAGSR